MCHPSAEAFVRERINEIGPIQRLLDVGCARDSAWRTLFSGLDRYVGVDQNPGPHVTHVGNFEDIKPGPGDLFNLVICTELLEHTLRPWLVVENLAAHLAPGGSLILTARGYDTGGYAPVHGNPPEFGDYWRVSCEGIASMLVDNGLDIVVCEPDTDSMWRGVLAHAINT